jgi:hypothetical protein
MDVLSESRRPELPVFWTGDATVSGDETAACTDEVAAFDGGDGGVWPDPPETEVPDPTV